MIFTEKRYKKWVKIRTENGKIGYVKTNTLQNEIYVRENITTEERTEKINLVWWFILSCYCDLTNVT